MNEPSRTASDLGRRLYGESVHITPAVIYTSLGAAFLLIGLLCFVVPPAPNAPKNAMLIAGLGVAGFGAICLVIGLVRLIPNLGASWHLHERGIRLVGRGGERVLRYDDIDVLTLKVVRVFLHGACTGEVHEATFEALDPPRKVFLKQVRRPSSVSGSDLDLPGELTHACGTVAGRIANRMAERLQRRETVPWFKGLRLHPDGLEGESPGVLQGLTAWGDIERVAINEGTFQLWRRGDSQPALKTPTHVANFFPGYRLIQERVQNGGQGPA